MDISDESGSGPAAEVCAAPVAEPTDDDLARLAASGDGAALERLIERNVALAVRVAYAITGNHDDALDAAQSGLSDVASRLRTRWSGGSFRAWLCSTVQHTAIDLVRHRSVQSRHRSAVASSIEYAAQSETEQNTDKEEALQILREELSRMPDRHYTVLAMHHLEGMPVAEVSSQLQISLDICKKRLVESRELLRERLTRRGVSVHSVAMLITWLGSLSQGSAAAPALSASSIKSLTQKVCSSNLAPALLTAGGLTLSKSMMLLVVAAATGAITVLTAGAIAGSSSATASSAVVVQTPAAAPRRGLETWQAQGNLRADVAPDSITVYLQLRDATVLNSAGKNVCAFRLISPLTWKAGDAPMTIGLNVEIPEGAKVAFELFAQTSPEQRIGLVYDADQVSVQGGDFLKGRVVTYEIKTADEVGGGRPLLGLFPEMAAGRHRLELKVAGETIQTRLDGQVVYEGRAQEAVSQAAFGFNLAVRACDLHATHRILVTHVTLRSEGGEQL